MHGEIAKGELQEACEGGRNCIGTVSLLGTETHFLYYKPIIVQI